MWSCGIILFELLTLGQHPIWKAKDDGKGHQRKRSDTFRDQYKDIVRDLFRIDLRAHNSFKKWKPSENCMQLLENLLSIS